MQLPAKVKYAIALIFFVWLIGGIAYKYFEGWETIDAFYFAAVTLTTVGYGDLYPHTFNGKLFTIIYVFTGIAIVLYTLSIIGAYYFEERFEARVLEQSGLKGHAERVHKAVGRLVGRKGEK